MNKFKESAIEDSRKPNYGSNIMNNSMKFDRSQIADQSIYSKYKSGVIEEKSRGSLRNTNV
jgi:hypothetical protein